MADSAALSDAPGGSPDSLQAYFERAGLQVDGVCETLSRHVLEWRQAAAMLEDLTPQEADILGKLMPRVRARAGQVLIRLDDADQKAQVAQAEANLQAAMAAVGNVDAQSAQEQAAIASRAAAVTQARAQAELARAEVDRYGKLAEQGWVSEQRIQTQRAQAQTANAAVAQAPDESMPRLVRGFNSLSVPKMFDRLKLAGEDLGWIHARGSNDPVTGTVEMRQIVGLKYGSALVRLKNADKAREVWHGALTLNPESSAAAEIRRELQKLGTP